MSENLFPTPRLRWVRRDSGMFLQQWWAPDVPRYMSDPAVGEWRDVPEGMEAP